MASGLAYVGRIEKLTPIPDADRIEAAAVVCGKGGRWCGVVQKGQFQPGERCFVYLQDAKVRPSERLAFLEKSQWRVRMQRFRGVPSECVITSPSIEILYRDCGVGDDITDFLGVEKYEKPIPTQLAGTATGGFPSFIPRTDEINFQAAQWMLDTLKGQPWYATVKYDGTSTTAYRNGDHFGVCSRNLELDRWHANAQWSVALKYKLDEKLPDGIALQWETVGPGIQGNPAGFKELDGRAFSAYDFRKHEYLSALDFLGLCFEIKFPAVDVIGRGLSFEFTHDALRLLSEGTYDNGKQREGIVIRPQEEYRLGRSRLSFKVLNLLYKS